MHASLRLPATRPPQFASQGTEEVFDLRNTISSTELSKVITPLLPGWHCSPLPWLLVLLLASSQVFENLVEESNKYHLVFKVAC